ncbi:hypothetical protein [uncultured Brevundimonas sp.]|uniref:hypothetical protein n=1 Tax=uncultured Brevundimonas sp. TaxID=213418 RepID=UPI0030ED05E8|tara:strand:- start:13394 stop:14515 length:1122 start_codon:yes stop_codon:yes gene_type:complete
MTDRTIRNLDNLRHSASTARLLNLLKVANDHGHTRAWAEQPLFESMSLNRAMILKHRLRRDELDCFVGRRHVATKIILPIDAEELKAGGRYTFINQLGFDRIVKEGFGLTPDHPDVETLSVLDQLPSLDPFLLRERLRRNGIEPAACYFAISESDLDQMSTFVESEIQPLVSLSVGDLEFMPGSVQTLAGKILSGEPGEHMEALRVTLRLAPDDYQEGIFCWKGFLYYKWVLTTLTAEISAVSDEVANMVPRGRIEPALKDYLSRTRELLRGRILRTCEEVRVTIEVYDNAFAGLSIEGQSGVFRDFLIEAPSMFSRLGEQLGALQHIVSFWRYRFAPGRAPADVGELIDILMDFEIGLLGYGETIGVNPAAA